MEFLFVLDQGGKLMCGKSLFQPETRWMNMCAPPGYAPSCQCVCVDESQPEMDERDTKTIVCSQHTSR